MSMTGSYHYFQCLQVFFFFVQYKHALLATALQLLSGPQPQDTNSFAGLVILYH